MFIIQKKGGSYTAGDIQGKTLVYHMLRVGKDDSWEHGEGNTDGSGSFNLSWLEGFDGSSGSTTGTIAVNTSGIVTIIGDSTAQGFMSSDKKTVVLTMGDASHGYHLMIMQITATEFTAGALPAGTAYAHMLGIGATTGWIHETTTVAPGGGMTFSDWVTNNPMFTAPSTTYTGNITTTSGTLTITGNPTFHGQISHDQKIIVGTQTQGSNPNYVYLLNVVTK
ncbi:MAG: hypothetical protein NTW65_09965 [Deltaproteobacteria bacterium]|nr:hypothetical protein [Deltaproteobacteria bacterium]